jgi:tetratricopeptide (TPR) repeat protein
MLGQFGETLVVDWGLAKVVGRSEPGAGEATLIASGSSIVETMAGSAVGTPAYMSPEQAEGKLDALGPRSDIYSLGAILFCLLTGQPPVQGDAAAVVLEKVRRGDITAPRALRPDVPPALEAVCLEALALRPTDRYPAVLALADDVKRWLADEPVSAYGEPWPVRAGRWARKHKPLVSGAAAALLVGIIAAAAGVLWYQEEQNREALRRAEAERKTMLAGAAVRHAVEQAQTAVEELHDILKKPGGVFELLNHPENWQSRIKLAEAALDRARALGKAETGLDPKLGADADKLQAALRQDDDDRRLAVRLEKIRMDQAAVVEGYFDYAGAVREYPQAFAEAGLAMPEGETEALATRIRSSRIKEQLVAALDDWAFVAYRAGKEEQAERILATGRQAAPDPAWGDRLRRLKLWQDRNALAKLIKEARPTGLSPQTLLLVGVLLGKDSLIRESWLRDAQAQFPADFWLNLDLGNALSKSNPLEAAGFLRVAIATRPGSSAAYNNLGIALCDQKKLPEAIAAYHKAIELDQKDALAYNNLGIALREQKKLPEAIAACHKAIELHPKFAVAHYNLGVTLGDQKKLPEAVAAYHKAIELDPKYALAYTNLGRALRYQKKLPEAVAAFHKAIELDPKVALAYHNLGYVLRDQNKLPEAIAAYHKAIELDPKYAKVYNNLGIALRDQKKLSEAVAAYYKAIELDPKDAKAYYNVGLALHEQKKLPEAIAAFRKAIELDPKDAKAHGALGRALALRGAFDEASLATRNALDLLPEGHSLRAMALNQLKQCQQMLALEKRLSLVLEGKEAAAAGELLKMALMCQQYKRRYPTAVRLYQDAFKADARLADDWTKQHRYNAACAAALAAAGSGEEAAKLTAEEKARLRQTARDWLQAELDAVRKRLKGAEPRVVIQAEDRLGHWQRDDDLAGVRDPQKLDGLPEAESKAWQALWTDVAGLLKEARMQFPGNRREGALTDKEKSHVHSWKLVAGRTYVIDLESAAFDAFLRLEDSAGKLLGQNDDISPTNRNSRLVFTPKVDGSYRIVATSFQQAGTGPYTLRVREFDR